MASDELIAKRKKTRAEVVAWIAEERLVVQKLGCEEIFDPEEYGEKPEHMKKVLDACDDDEALATFLVVFVREWCAAHPGVSKIYPAMRVFDDTKH